MSTDPTHEVKDDDEIVDAKETSILFEPFTIWVLVALLLIAIWFKFLPFIAVMSFLLLLFLVIYVWKERSLKHLDVALQLSHMRLFVGDELTAQLSIKNNKWLPLVWLECEFWKADTISWGNHGTRSYIVRFLWLLSHQQISWSVKGQAIKRGVYQMGHLITRSGDAFRFTEKKRVHQLNQEIYIYPKMVSVHMPQFRPSLQWDVTGKRGGFLEDPLLVTGIREYEPGDEWRRLNWRASARVGKMLTNVYQPVISEQVNIFIDVQGFMINANKYVDDPPKQKRYENEMNEKFEWYLSVIASFAVTFAKQGVSIGYVSNGINYLGGKLRSVLPSAQITHVLDQIAQMTSSVQREPLTSLNTHLHENKRAIPLYFFCERVTKQHYMWLESNRQKQDIEVYYVNENEYSYQLNSAKNLEQLLAKSVGS